MGTEDLKSRIKNGIIIVANGQPFKVKDLLLWIKDKNTLTVTGWTKQNGFDNIDREIALSELTRIKLSFSKMLKASIELEYFIKGKQVEYYLNYDYGKGSVEVCSEINSVTRFYNYN